MVGSFRSTLTIVPGANRCSRRQDGFIAYAVQRFPALRTTFVRREVDALRALEVPLEVMSMRPADLEELHGESEAKSHLVTTHYLARWPLDFESVYANLWAIIRHPYIYIRNWKLAVVDLDRRLCRDGR